MSRERVLNEALAKAVATRPGFAAWLISLTPFVGVAAKTVLARGDNPWSKSPADGVESETDILLVFECEDQSRFALHIENKLPGDRFRPGQAARYRTRAAEWVGLPKWGGYTEFSTIILAPAAFIASDPQTCSLFDSALTYEAVSEFVPEFRVL